MVFSTKIFFVYEEKQLQSLDFYSYAVYIRGYGVKVLIHAGWSIFSLVDQGKKFCGGFYRIRLVAGGKERKRVLRPGGPIR